ncbi:hypothetical protein ACH4NS_19645 [Streptomyces mutabilis]|uniref:hypothetical protein n=1 Tax=Streptomyces mutabilis TaxID=67332 RepID=UPI00379C069E
MTTTDLSAGSARLVLLNGVTLLHPEDAVFDAMLEGWTRQQRGGRRLQTKTISDRLRVVRQFNDLPGLTRGTGRPPRWTNGRRA